MLLFSHIFFTKEFYIFAETMSNYIDIHTHAVPDAATTTSIISHRLGMEAPPRCRYFSAGIHPWDAEILHPTLSQQLKQLEMIDCVAFGEIGLDKACDADFEIQREIFERQTQLAATRDLPVIIHCVRSLNEVVEILSRNSISRAIFHGFIGSPEQASQITAHRWHISFGFNALRSPKTLRALRHIPLEALFLENDTSQRRIEELYEIVCKTRNIEIEELKNIINNNFHRFFEL